MLIRFNRNPVTTTNKYQIIRLCLFQIYFYGIFDRFRYTTSLAGDFAYFFSANETVCFSKIIKSILRQQIKNIKFPFATNTQKHN